METDKIDRSQVIVAKRDMLDNMDTQYWSHASIDEKLQTIMYLRECFYGKEANTGHPKDAGRLQRVYSVFKLK